MTKPATVQVLLINSQINMNSPQWTSRGFPLLHTAGYHGDYTSGECRWACSCWGGAVTLVHGLASVGGVEVNLRSHRTYFDLQPLVVQRLRLHQSLHQSGQRRETDSIYSQPTTGVQLSLDGGSRGPVHRLNIRYLKVTKFCIHRV